MDSIGSPPVELTKHIIKGLWGDKDVYKADTLNGKDLLFLKSMFSHLERNEDDHELNKSEVQWI